MSAEELQKIISPKFTEEVLLEIVSKKIGLDDAKITKIEIANNVNKRDSYISNSCRFVVEVAVKNSTTGTEKLSIPVFVKYFPKNVVWKKTYRTDEFFENEIIFYDKVWPLLQQFQDSKKPRTKFNNIPLIFSTYHDGLHDYIAMLDVSYGGFKTPDRNVGLNYDQAMVFLKLLGRFHALSLAMKDQQPQIFEKTALSLKEIYCAEKYRNWFVPYQKKLIAVVRDAVEKELPPIYLEKYDQSIANDLYGTMCKLREIKGPLAVVTHGDVWKPNFLIKYNPLQEIMLDDIVIIDFQLARYSSLANDVTFFFYCCLDMSLLEKHWDDFVGQYYTALVDNVEALGSDKSLVTLEDVLSEIKAHNTFGIGMAIEGITNSLMEDNEITDLSAIQGTEAVSLESIWNISPFKEQEKRRKVADFIKFSVDKNFL